MDNYYKRNKGKKRQKIVLIEDLELSSDDSDEKGSDKRTDKEKMLIGKGFYTRES